MSTYILIQSQTLASSARTVTFSSIPATYTDLVLRVSARGDVNANDQIILQINTDTSTNYSATGLYGNGATAATNQYSTSAPSYTGYNVVGSGATANTFSNAEFYIPNYTSSANKPISQFGVEETNATTAYLSANAILWRGTSAVNQLYLTTVNNANFITGSSFYLYGISSS